MQQTGDTTETTLLRRAFDHWRSELHALGGPDDLLALDVTSPRLLDLGVAHPNGLAGFLAGRATRLSTLFRSPDSLRTARERARALDRAARRLSDVYGLPGAFLATGVFRLEDEVRGEVRAPIVLRPLTLVPRGSGAEVDFDVEPGDEARFNPALLALLAEHGLALPDDRVSADDHGMAARQLIERFAAAAYRLDGTILDRTLIGTFSEIGPAMVAALDRHEAEIAAHPTIRALLARPSQTAANAPAVPASAPAGAGAGGRVAEQNPGGLSWQVADQQPAGPADSPAGQSAPAPATRREPPRAQLLDEAQRAVLQAVRAGGDVRVEAAPGSGVTTTAAAVVEALTGDGRQVLVVAPTLDELADLVLELRSDVRAVAAAVDTAESAHQLLHAVDETWGLSRMQVLSRLAALGAAPEDPAAARLSSDTLRALAADRSVAVGLLSEADQADAYSPLAVASPWAGAAVADGSAAEQALTTVHHLLERDLPAAESALREVAEAVGLPVGLSLTEWKAQVEVLTSVRTTLDLMRPTVYEHVNDEMVAACASSNWRASHGVNMSMLERRRWRREASALVRPGLQAADLHASLARARLEKDLWQRLGGRGEPTLSPRLPDAITAYEKVADAAASLEPILAGSAAGGDLADLGIDELRQRLRQLAATGSDLQNLPERARATSQLDTLGLTPLVGQLRATAARGGGDHPDVAQALEVAWLRGVLAELGGLPADADGVGSATARVEPKLLPDVPVAVADQVVMTTALALGALPEAVFDTVLLVDAHRIGLSEAVLAISRGQATVVIGDPVGNPPTGADLAAAEQPRSSVLAAGAGRLPTHYLDRVHRQPRALADLAHRLAGPDAVAPAWSVASAAGGELALVHVPGSTVSADETGETVPGQEVEGVVAQIAEHVRLHPTESLAVFTAGPLMAAEVSDALRRAVRRSPELADWLTAEVAEPLALTDLRHAEEVTRDHVILALGVAEDSFGRFSHRFGLLDGPSGSGLLASGVGRARRRLTVVASLWPHDIDAELLVSDGGRAALTLLSAAHGDPAAAADTAADTTADTDVDSDAPSVPAEEPVLDLLASRSTQWGMVVRGTRHDREPDLAFVRADGRPTAVLWYGYPDAGHRRPLAEALRRFGWNVQRVSPTEIIRAPERVAGSLSRP